MENRAHALARAELIRVLTAYSGITTSDGEGDGTTLIDSNLKDNPSISATAIPEKTILITSGDAIQEDKGAASFDNLTGKITLQAGFSVQITAGTTFRILNISSVETDIARIEDKIDSLAGGAFWGSYGPRNVEVDNDVDFGIMLYDPSGNVITTGEITPGTYTIRRVRGAVDTEIVSATASSEAAGRVYMTYAFPAASWAVGDIFYITFAGISVTIDTTTTEYPNLFIWGRVVREADISADLGDMADAATSDDLSDITTTSALAKLRLILNRLSPDAFTATIHAGARTSLDTMLAEMAKYFVADGGGFDLKINNGVNRDNLNLIMRDFFTVIGILNTSIWQPTIGGGTQATVVAAVQALANYWAPLGAGLDIKINNGVNRDDLKNILKDYFAVFGISDTSIWQPVIAGGTRTTVVAAIQALADLWAPPGEGLDFKINNGTNKDSLKEILQDYMTMIGCLGTSVFNPTIDGSARTTFDAAWTALAALLGTKATAAAEGAVTSDDSMMAYVKQLVTLLLNGTYGLSAIHTDVATVDAIVDDISANLAAVINNYLGHGTHGLSPIRSALTTIDAIVDDISANVAAVINNYLGHGTHGLSPIRSALTTIDAIVDDILANLVAVINNYLNHATFGLSGIHSDLETVDGVVDGIKTQTDKIAGKMLFSMDFWSLPQEEVAITDTAGDKALPSVTVADLPGTATIVRAIAMFKFRMVENHTYAGANALNGAQEIQVAGSVDAINFVDTQFTLAQDTREGGDVIIGVIDIATTVNANGAYAFHWDLADAQQDGIKFNDIQMGIRIWYSV